MASLDYQRDPKGKIFIEAPNTAYSLGTLQQARRRKDDQATSAYKCYDLNTGYGMVCNIINVVAVMLSKSKKCDVSCCRKSLSSPSSQTDFC